MPGKVSVSMKRLGDEHTLDGIKITEEKTVDTLSSEELKAKVAYKEELQQEISKHKETLKEYKKDIEIAKNEGKETKNLDEKLSTVKQAMLETIRNDLGLTFYVKSIAGDNGTKKDVIFLHTTEGADYYREAFDGNEETLERELTAIYKELYDFDLGEELGIEEELHLDLVESQESVGADLAGLKKGVTEGEQNNTQPEGEMDKTFTGVIDSVINFVKSYNPATSPKRAHSAMTVIKSLTAVAESFGGSFLAGLFSLPGTGGKITELATLLGVDKKSLNTSNSKYKITIPKGFAELKTSDFDLMKGLLPANYGKKQADYLEDYGFTSESLIDSEKLDKTLKAGTPSTGTLVASMKPSIDAVAAKVGVEPELLLANTMLFLSKRNDKHSIASHIPGAKKSSEWKGMSVAVDGKDIPYVPDWNSGLIIAAHELKSFSDQHTDVDLDEKLRLLCSKEDTSEETFVAGLFENRFNKI